MDVTDVIGNFGPAQKYILALGFIRSFPIAFMYYCIHFKSANVEFWCAPPAHMLNMTSVEWQNCCIPLEHNIKSRCMHYEVLETGLVSNSSTVSCQKWEYNEAQSGVSLKQDWDIVCDREWYQSLIYFSFFASNLLGLPLSGYVADKYGRKAATLFGAIALFFTTLGFTLSPHIISFLVFRTISGFFYTFLQSTSLGHFLEVVGKSERKLVNLISGFSFYLASVILIGVSVVILQWRTYYLTVTFAFLLPYIFLCWKFLPESPRWLIARKKYKEAEAALLYISNINGIKIVDMESVMNGLKLKLELEQHCEGIVKFSDVLKDKNFIKVMAIFFASLMVAAMQYTGFIITLRYIGKNFEIAFVLTCVLGSLASCIFFFLYAMPKKKLILTLLYATSGICLVTTSLLDKDNMLLQASLCMLCFLCISIALGFVFQYSAEILPTKLRMRGISVCMVATRIGTLVSSFTNLWVARYGQSPILATFGTLSLVIAISYFFIPVMDPEQLPESLAGTKCLMKSPNEEAKVSMKGKLLEEPKI